MGTTLKTGAGDPPPVEPTLVAPGDAEGDKNRASIPAKPNVGDPDPELILGKFKTQEDLVAAYTALEKKQSQEPVEPAKGDPPKVEDPPKKPAQIPTEPTAKVGDEGGIDIAAIEKEWFDNDGLSDKTYKQLQEKKGLDRTTVDVIIAGRQAQAAEFTAELAKTTDGVENMNKILEWAKELPKEAQEAFNKVTASGDLEQSKLALAGLQAQYVAANGKTPSLVEDDVESNATTGGAKPFENRAQVVEAMKDKRYAKDPAYRATVEKRLAAMDF